MTAQVVTPHEAKKLIDTGATPVDVRGKDEHAREKIAHSQHIPITGIQGEGLRGNFKKGDKVVAYCQIGKRSTAFAKDIEAALEPATLYVVEGGLNSWKAAGLPVLFDSTQPLPIMRQVQLIAGSLVVLGVLLGTYVSPKFLLISAFIGSGLMFAGATGWCGMALLLAQMPWNKNAAL